VILQSHINSTPAHSGRVFIAKLTSKNIYNSINVFKLHYN